MDTKKFNFRKKYFVMAKNYENLYYENLEPYGSNKEESYGPFWGQTPLN